MRWEGAFVFSTGVAAAESFLGMQDRPTGIFAACDESAIGFIKRVREERIRVPQDVSVIGCDGIELREHVCRATVKRPRFIAVTGIGTRDDLEPVRAAGFDHVLLKPVEPGELLTVLEGL